jgi:hypothetical protein
MNLLEKMIDRTERRIKRIKENPDPTKLQSNLLGYELDLDTYRAQLEAWQQGRPIWVNPLYCLPNAMGFVSIAYPQLAQNFPEEAPKYLQIMRSLGMPEYTCDYQNYGATMAIAGDAPPPSVIWVHFAGCAVEPYVHRMLAEHFDVPYIEVDAPQHYSEDNVRYLADRFGEVIEFCESRVPGIKYDQDKHIELLEGLHNTLVWDRKVWDLLKHRPCPMSSREQVSMALHRKPQLAIDRAKAYEYLRLRTEEVEERVAKGIGIEEKLRFLWVWSFPGYMNPFTLLQSRGVVAIPALGKMGSSKVRWGGKWETEEFGRKLSPLEEEARITGNLNNRKTGEAWTDTWIWACQQQQVDAIVMYQHVGCLPMASLFKVTAEKAERELGIPSLILSGSPMNAASLPPAEIESKLMGFVDMVLAEKGGD